MGSFFQFGEDIEGFSYKVINERDARASAGIMFLLGLTSLFSVFIFRTLFWAELFSITFIFEFIVRVFYNPKYSPYMLLGGLIVKNQYPDWVEAKPKQFAWGLGMLLGAFMSYYIIFDVISLVRLWICVVCLVLLFLESAFGICLGCMLYIKLNLTPKNCPGGVCKAPPDSRFGKKEVLLLAIFTSLFISGYFALDRIKHVETANVIIIDE